MRHRGGSDAPRRASDALRGGSDAPSVEVKLPREGSDALRVGEMHAEEVSEAPQGRVFCTLRSGATFPGWK